MVEDFGKRVSDYGPEVVPQPSAPPEPSIYAEPGSVQGFRLPTVEEWRADIETNEHPMADTM